MFYYEYVNVMHSKKAQGLQEGWFFSVICAKKKVYN